MSENRNLYAFNLQRKNRFRKNFLGFLRATKLSKTGNLGVKAPEKERRNNPPLGPFSGGIKLRKKRKLAKIVL